MITNDCMCGGALPDYGHVTVGVKSSKMVPSTVTDLNQSPFFDYFSVKYLHAKYGSVLCAVPYWLKWYAPSKHLLVPEKALAHCWLNSGAQFVFQPVEISTTQDSHANAIIIDVRNKRAERFEPHGARESLIFPNFNYAELDQRLSEFFGNLGVQYHPPSMICPVSGPQSIEEIEKDRRVEGYCAAWSLWYVDMRMSYPDAPQLQLIESMTKKAADLAQTGGLHRYLQRFLSQVYQYMYTEFPQYRKFFDRYRYYVNNPTQEFQAFEAHMQQLATADQNVSFTGRRGRKASAARPATTILPPLSRSRMQQIEKLVKHLNRVVGKLTP